MAHRRKHFSDFAARSGASWRGQMINGVCEDVSGSSAFPYEGNRGLSLGGHTVPKQLQGVKRADG